MLRTLLTPLLAAFALSACVETAPPTPTAPTAPVESTAAQSYLFGWAMYAEPVFDRDVITFERAFSAAFGAPAESRTFGYTSSQLEQPGAGQALDAAMQSLAAQAVDGRDTVVVMLTTHGSPDVLALQPQPGMTLPFPADAVRGLLAPLENDRQIVIIQACFSGSLIDDLRAPNRIILTAAAADRSSFGCNPNNNNTFFIQALNQALGQGGSWSQIFTRTQAIVSQMESERGLLPSNPQMFVGSQMRDLWQGAQS